MKWIDNGEDVMSLLPDRLRSCANIDWGMLKGIYGWEDIENDED